MPGFPAYLRQAVRIWRAPANGDPILASALRDLGRFVSGIWALYPHATQGGITLGRLSNLLEQTGISGPGRARSMLIYLRFIGFIEPAPTAGDSRVRGFRPTDRMTAAFRERYRMEFEAAAPLDPTIAAGLDRLEDPAFFNAMAAALGELLLAGLQAFQSKDKSLDVISHRFAGMMVLGELLALADQPDQPFPPVGPVRYSLLNLANACGISRTQVRRILEIGEKEGFFELKGEGELVLTPLLAEHVLMLVACSPMMHEWSCAQALATTQSDSINALP